MSDITYRIDKELQSPWFSKAYVEYQLVKEYDYFDYDSISCWGETRRTEKIIFKSKDKNLVENFLKELEGKDAAQI